MATICVSAQKRWASSLLFRHYHHTICRTHVSRFAVAIEAIWLLRQEWQLLASISEPIKKTKPPFIHSKQSIIR